jgi:hypothetical protein
MRASADGLRRTTRIQEGKMKSIAVGSGKMGYIVKTSSIYRQPASRKEAVLWYHMVTENHPTAIQQILENCERSVGKIKPRNKIYHYCSALEKRDDNEMGVTESTNFPSMK